MAVERATVRRARKERPCGDNWCSRTIKPGELYLEHVTGPGHDILDNENWLRSAECARCASERGDPIREPGATLPGQPDPQTAGRT